MAIFKYLTDSGETRWGVDWRRAGQQYSFRGFRRKVSAKLWWQAHAQSRNTTTLNTVGETWRSYRNIYGRNHGRKWEQERIQTWKEIAGDWETADLRRVSSPHIARWVDHAAMPACSTKQAVVARVKLLHLIFQHAVDLEIIDHNPATKILAYVGDMPARNVGQPLFIKT